MSKWISVWPIFLNNRIFDEFSSHSLWYCNLAIWPLTWIFWQNTFQTWMEKYLVQIFWQQYFDQIFWKNIQTRYFGKMLSWLRYLAKGPAIDPDMNRQTFLQPFIINQSSLDLAKIFGLKRYFAKLSCRWPTMLSGHPSCSSEVLSELANLDKSSRLVWNLYRNYISN